MGANSANRWGNKTCCPECKDETPYRLLYGHPLPSDFHPNCMYGGEYCDPFSPTYYCNQCNIAWSVVDCPPLFFPFPEACYFCSSPLSEKDKLVFGMEFEDWIGNNETSLRLSDDTFTVNLLPVCKKCRKGIRENQHELTTQTNQELRQRIVGVRLAIGVLLLFMFLLALSVLILLNAKRG